ncbi:MAG: rane protein [Bacillales bacterium]|nr:rane protein [Bacillales bacterium]
MDYKGLRWLIRILVFLLLVSSLYILMKLKPFWAPILDIAQMLLIPTILAFFLAYLLHPIVEFIVKKGLNRNFSILFIYAIFLSIAGFGIYKGVPLIVEQVKDLSDQIPSLIKNYKEIYTDIHNKTQKYPLGIHSKIESGFDNLEGVLNRLADRSFNFMGTFLRHTFELLMVPFISYYMLKDYKKGLNKFWLFVPEKWRKVGQGFIEDVDNSIGGYIRGQFFVAISMAIVTTIALWILKVDYAIVFGIINGITNIIPYFGPILGAIPVIVYAASISFKYALTIGVILIIIQLLESNILNPIIVGRSISMHPVTIMFLLVIGGEFAGIFGMIFIIPFFSLLKIVIKYFRMGATLR